MIATAQHLTIMPLDSEPLLSWMRPAVSQNLDFEAFIKPETPLESHLLSLPEFQEGYDWGKPRFGHPEGKVGLHVREVLDNVERLPIDETTRNHLRLLSIVHDTFKFRESKLKKQGIGKHHGSLTREFVEQFRYIREPHLLDIIELHDEAYHIWRCFEQFHQPAEAHKRLDLLLERLGENLPLYYLFFKCDTETGDKIQAPLRWFERLFPEIAGDFC